MERIGLWPEVGLCPARGSSASGHFSIVWAMAAEHPRNHQQRPMHAGIDSRRLLLHGGLPARLLLPQRVSVLGQHRRAGANDLAFGRLSGSRARASDLAAQGDGFVPRQTCLRRLGLVPLQRARRSLATARRLRGPLAVRTAHALGPLWVGRSAAGAVPRRQMVPGTADVHGVRLDRHRLPRPVRQTRFLGRLLLRQGYFGPCGDVWCRQALCRQLQVGSARAG